ncbi:MAG: response regulator transcription factor [Gammaproteobacteria bacterium]|nr:response regulator transcription factor [Gammaproteobacteria bacterium]
MNDEGISVLLVDDDITFCEVLSRALEKRGYVVHVAHDVHHGRRLAQQDPPEYAIVDLKMPGPSGLELVAELIKLDPATRIVVLTGYASITTAVEAIKLGAVHYLSKPANLETILAAFSRIEGDTQAPVADKPLSVARMEWEHIQSVLNECDGNISETARRLNMHRRTLQRKLQKRPTRN